MHVLFPPSTIQVSGKSVFLAGTIDMGNSSDWQADVIMAFEEIVWTHPITILNPRRKEWDNNWKQEIQNPKFAEQVNWELDALEKADVILLYLAAGSYSPVSMLELGLFGDSGKLIVCCENRFWRKGNIDIVCKRKNIPVCENLHDLITVGIQFLNR